MSGKQYLKNQLPVLLLNLLGVLALALFLIATGTSRQAISFIALVWIVVVVCYLTVSFFIQKRHCETLLVMAEQLGEKYLMPEVMAMPERADEQVFYQILKMAEKSMLEKIGEIQSERQEYKEYIEQWIHEVKTPITAMKLICENNRSEFTRELLVEVENINHFKGYTGYLINGAVETECPQLRIIEPELFEQAQELRQARTCERGGTSLGTSSKALLTGLVYCGHCGNRLSLTSSGRTHTYADGHTVKEVRPRYSCFYKIRHPGDCDGQSGYGVSKLDSIVEEVVRQIFAQFREVSRKKLLESVKTNDAARIQKKVKKIQKDLESKQKELDDLKAETILVIRGVSALDKELLGTLVAEARETLETLEKQLVQAQEEYEEATKTAKRSNYICNELFTWADVYDTANHDERRAILQQFIAEIRVRKDYEISITLNASFNQVEQLKAVSTYDGAEIFEEISEKGA